ncbi:uncharacterized protein LOC111051199 [Nilaparvata lugens]|uniref:uncharacterized protein LOC111051199 n=1 Tax=Nilaparvata lugens TaxID=108931 RepID=UPI00193D09D2|nr:uncharacterized protein LOC111051199 [Nilaparvata lugens]XP_039288805.1 uncharacterized protein LOC111051199 [Nilaparvata lugens]
MDGSMFSNTSSFSRRDTSYRERHSLNDIYGFKIELAKSLWYEFMDMVDKDEGGTNEIYFNFSKYIKDNSDYIKGLVTEINGRNPVAYPRFPAEARTLYMTSLSNELTELKKMKELKKRENFILKRLQKNVKKATEAINKVIEESETKKQEEEMIDSIERKILDCKFKEAKDKLNYILKKVFPNKEHKAVSNILEKLFHAEDEEETNNEKWIEIGDEDHALVQGLLRANIIEINKENKSEIRLLQS